MKSEKKYDERET